MRTPNHISKRGAFSDGRDARSFRIVVPDRLSIPGLDDLRFATFARAMRSWRALADRYPKDAELGLIHIEPSLEKPSRPASVAKYERSGW